MKVGTVWVRSDWRRADVAQRVHDQVNGITPGMELREHIDERRAALKKMQVRRWDGGAFKPALIALAAIAIVALARFMWILGVAWLRH